MSQPESAAFREWISGRFPYADPPAWRHEATPAGVRIVPAWKPLLLWCVFIVGLAAFPTLIFRNPHGMGRPTELILAVPFLFVASGITLAVGLLVKIAGGLLIEHVRGPYLIYTSDDGAVVLPRAGVRVDRRNVVGWRVVSGNWVGPAGAQRRRDKPISELQLIVDRDGERWAYVVAGTLRSSMGSDAEGVARLTGWPLEAVVQHQGVNTPPERIPNQGWRSN